jgi:site-specific DNA-methyltransferase (adenine-specific)
VIDLRLGRWEDVLADVERVDAVITDPPYTTRTETGFRSGNDARHGNMGFTGEERFEYESWDESQLRTFVRAWASRASDWFVAFNDHVGWAILEDELRALGWYTFAPVIWLRRNGGARLMADGPTNSVEHICVAASATEHICVARPRGLPRVRSSRPGYYDVLVPNHKGERGIVTGAKPVELMRAIIRDYTEPGGTIVDPTAGGGTTLLAAAQMGRNAIGAEVDPTTHTKAQARLDEYQRDTATQPGDLFTVPTEHTRGRQRKLEIPR